VGSGVPNQKQPAHYCKRSSSPWKEAGNVLAAQEHASKLKEHAAFRPK